MNVGIEALSVVFPEHIVLSDEEIVHLKKDGINQPEKKTVDSFAGQSSTTKPVSGESSSAQSRWNELSQKYKSDPFLGVKKKHVLKEEESILTYACDAAHRALKAADLTLEDIDMLIVSSMFPEHVDEGDASYLSAMLGFKGIALNISAMCSAPFVALKIAGDLIAGGANRKIMVISTCTYSRSFSGSWRVSKMSGDAAAAFIVGELKDGQGIVATRTVNSHKTNGIFYNTIEVTEEGGWRRQTKHVKNAGELVSHFFPQLFQETCVDFLASEKIDPESIDFFTSFNATGWYGEYCLEQLGLPESKSLDLFPEYGFISNVFCLATLFEAQKRGRIKENDLVLVYNHGFTSNCVSMLMRWGDVALG